MNRVVYSSLIAHHKSLSYHGVIRCLETLRATAPGRPITLMAIDDMGAVLAATGGDELALRVALKELGRATAHGHSWQRLATVTTLQLMARDRNDEALQLSLDAIGHPDFKDSGFWHEVCAWLLSKKGDHRAALAHFEMARRDAEPASLHRETLLGIARSSRKLGDARTARRLEAEASRSKRSWSRALERWTQDTTPPAARATLQSAARPVDPERPRAWWLAVLTADWGIVALWPALTVVFAILTWRSPEKKGWRHPSRAIIGAVLLVMAGILPSSFMFGWDWASEGLFAVAPLMSARAVLWWSSRLGGAVLVVFLAIPFIERQSLSGLGWRRAPHLGRYLVLAVILSLLFAAAPIIYMARGDHGRMWILPVLLTSLLRSLCAAFSEETLYRGYLLVSLRRVAMPFWVVNLIQALFFTAVHVVTRLGLPGREWHDGVVVWTALGLLLGWITRRSQSLWPPFLAHLLYNLPRLYTGYLDQYEALRRAVALSSMA